MKPYLLDYNYSRNRAAHIKDSNAAQAMWSLGLQEARPFLATWKTPEFEWVERRSPEADFFFVQSSGLLGVHANAFSVEEVRQGLEKCGELLPIVIEGVIHYIWHPTRLFDGYNLEISNKLGPYGDRWTVRQPAFDLHLEVSDWIIRPRYTLQLFLPDDQGLLAAAAKYGLTGLEAKLWDFPSMYYAESCGKPEYGIPAPPPPPAPEPVVRKPSRRIPDAPRRVEKTDGVIRLKDGKKALWPAITDVLKRFRLDHPEMTPSTACLEVSPAYGSLFFSFNTGDQADNAALTGTECQWQGWGISSGKAFVQAFENACNTHTYLVEKQDGTLINGDRDGFECYEEAVIDGIANITLDYFENGKPVFQPTWLIVEKEGDYFHRWRLEAGRYVADLG